MHSNKYVHIMYKCHSRVLVNYILYIVTCLFPGPYYSNLIDAMPSVAHSEQRGSPRVPFVVKIKR